MIAPPFLRCTLILFLHPYFLLHPLKSGVASPAFLSRMYIRDDKNSLARCCDGTAVNFAEDIFELPAPVVGPVEGSNDPFGFPTDGCDGLSSKKTEIKSSAEPRWLDSAAQF